MSEPLAEEEPAPPLAEPSRDPEQPPEQAAEPSPPSAETAKPKPRFEWPPIVIDSRAAFAGLLGGFALTAITNGLAIAIGAPWPHGGLLVRLEHQAFDAAELIGLGALAGVILAVWLRFVKAPWWVHFAAYTAAATPAMFAVLGQDLLRQALVPLNGKVELFLYPLFVLLCGLAVPCAHVIGASFSTFRRLRAVPLVVALGGIVTNHLIVRDDYCALHAAITWTAATLAGATLAPEVAALITRATSRWGARRTYAPIAVVALAGLFIPPSNAVRLALFHEPGSMAAWILATAYWRLPKLSPSVTAPESPWFADRSTLPPIPPTRPPLLAKAPVVVLITVDATRADDVADPAHDAMFPTLAMMKRVGAFFTTANSPGGQTAVSLSTAFSGKYFSELYWSYHGIGETRFTYPADDPSVRYPEILAAHGVTTVTFSSVNFLAGDFGVSRGFTEARVIPTGRAHAFAQQMIDPLLNRLQKAGPGPLFLYVHLMEPHAPYDRGKVTTGPLHDRYVSEIAVADAQIGRVAQVLARKFGDRGVLIVSADHGEAFGEHGTWEHTKTLYEELLHVPLLVRGAGVVPRRIDQRVGLVDVGATILDIFGIETPGTWEGQSLVPLLAGRAAHLDRPLGAEGRLRQAFYFGDSLKAIEDPRRKVVEVYDLARDPGELVNLFDTDRATAEPALAALRAFFGAHALHKPGYSPIYKP